MKKRSETIEDLRSDLGNIKYSLNNTNVESKVNEIYYSTVYAVMETMETIIQNWEDEEEEYND